MKKFLSLILAGALVLVGSNAFAEGMIQIKGSDTLINIVQRLAEVYMEQNPGSYIAVTGGGSGTGVAALINNKCDIANASRLMKPKEISMAADNGVTAKRIVIGLDGLSVVVNSGSGVENLTMDQIGAIFRGEVTNWSQVGGANMSINLYGRQPNSGTYQFFQEFVLKGDYSPKMRQMNGNAQIIEGIKSDASGIGYVGVGYLKEATGVVVVNVAGKSGGVYVSPLNPADVKSGKYPLSRPLNQYINGVPKGELRKFLEFELSDEGQKLVEEDGFIPIPPEYEEFNAQAGL